ncbi:MAG: alpha-amylase family protein [Rhodothermales bacterium]|nr:alpha-amylase family protein [Rhodothermales bacterium]MBO6778463.1 alpha-amylase family protein [Rhodothermales bacterium]
MKRFLPLLLLVAACAQPESVPDASEPVAVSDWSQGEGVVVHLFEWRWDDIADECEDVLGPAGYSAVQVSPPSENHVVGTRPWWERYQPVSYQLETRSGSREDFADMVRRCDDAGVDIMVDAVINHTTDGDLEHPSMEFTARGTAGTEFSSYNFPGLYTPEDFHDCGLTDNNDIHDFNDREQVENCELVDLADLDTASPKVRSTLAAYLADLQALGVKALRVDAARHMAAEDLLAIIEEAEWEGYVVQEVTESAHARRYVPSGAVTDFDFGFALSRGIRDLSLSDIVRDRFWETDNMDSEWALSFVDNHDTQRHGGVLSYKDDRYPLAVGMLLAVGYGRPRVMSSYRFDFGDQGPPADADENILRVNGDDGIGCGDERVCEHRWPMVLGMVGFEAATRGQDVMRLQEGGADRVAFTRGDRGWVAFNRSAEPWEVVHQTGLPGTRYCDVAQGPPTDTDGGCAGGSVRVDAGMVSATVPPGGLVAIHVNAQAN